jgi:hypothetical protein
VFVCSFPNDFEQIMNKTLISAIMAEKTRFPLRWSVLPSLNKVLSNVLSGETEFFVEEIAG